MMIEVMIQLIQSYAILVLVDWLGLRAQLVVLLQKAAAESTEHFHDAEFKLVVSVAGARVEDNVLRFTLITDYALAGISTPQVAVDYDWNDPFAAVQVVVSYQARDDLGSGLLDQVSKLAIFTVGFLRSPKDES